jgi:hypothetical protein
MADSVTELDQYKGYWAHAQILLMFEGNLDEALLWFLRSQAVRTDDLHWRYMNYPTRLFTWIGEYNEARRWADRFSYLVDVAEGRFDDAIRTTSNEMRRDPNDSRAIRAVADVLYDAGRHDEALPLYERLRDFAPDGMPLAGSRETTMRLAIVRRFAGDEQAARAAAESVKTDLLRVENYLQELGQGHHRLHLARAMLAAFEREPDRVIGELESAVRLGLRDAQVLDDIVFAELRNDPRFVALERELDAILTIEHKQVLQLICFNNPTPDNWQPLAETCEGVVE